MQYEAVIGLEVHAQLLTESKIFCSCSTQFGAEPNTQVCPVCLGMPGVLPVLNKKAVEYTIKTGLAMNCKIARISRFARKNYFYPDLPKGYQISQYELPLCEEGYLEILVDGVKKKIRIKRIHLEEDAGKNIHDPSGYSFVDFNRTGVPLMEIVSEPDIRTPKEAALYMKKLRAILRYLGVCDGNLEQGSLRCDANVSIRPVGSTDFGVKTEIKNINSFRFVEKALEYEIKRQIKLVERGEKIIQETRLWDAQTGTTQSMRSKEEAHDYRYFPEPDLVPVFVSEEWIERLKKELPELPNQKIDRYLREFELPLYDSEILTEERELAEFFEETVKEGVKPKDAANWIMVELLRILNEKGKSINECTLKPAQLAELIKLVDKGVINRNTAKDVFDEMFRTGKSAESIVNERGLTQISDDSIIEEKIREVMKNFPKEVERFRNGEDKLIGFFVGQVMKATKGKANPKLLNELIIKVLKEAS